MTQFLHECLTNAGYDTETIAAIAASPAMCATLAEYYELRAAHVEEGGRGVEVTAVVDTRSHNTDNRGKSTFTSDAKRVYQTAKELFGGFTRSQVARLLAVCRYKHVAIDRLISLMYALRAQSWARGWIRTREAVAAL
jgi:hypothetical protein